MPWPGWPRLGSMSAMPSGIPWLAAACGAGTVPVLSPGCSPVKLHATGPAGEKPVIPRDTRVAANG
jgi:hypothetical protein